MTEIDIYILSILRKASEHLDVASIASILARQIPYLLFDESDVEKSLYGTNADLLQTLIQLPI